MRDSGDKRLPAAAIGSRLVRDGFVLTLAALCAAPLIVCFPRATAALLSAWLLAFFTPLPYWLLRRIAGQRPGSGQAVPRVAVLAGGFARDGTLSQRTHRRLLHGSELARQIGVELILCGGALSGGHTEAEAMERLARDSGHHGPLRREGRSRSTLENLLALCPLLAAASAGPIWVVTCPQHVPRVRRISAALSPHLHPVAYPIERLPGGVADRLGLAGECLYECAVNVWLTLRVLMARLGLVPPLSAIVRPHLFTE